MHTRLLATGFLAGLCVVSLHCGVTQPVRVLDAGSTQLSASLGGPFIPLGSTTIPEPDLHVGVAYGYSSGVTLSGNLHILPIPFYDLGLDAGASTCLVRQTGAVPEITGKAMVMFFSGFRDVVRVRVYPVISVNASYLIGSSSLAYLGADQVYQTTVPRWMISPFIGLQFPIGGKWAGQIETKWLAANVNTAHGILEGQTNIADHGNTSLYVAVLYTL